MENRTRGKGRDEIASGGALEEGITHSSNARLNAFPKLRNKLYQEAEEPFKPLVQARARMVGRSALGFELRPADVESPFLPAATVKKFFSDYE